MSQESVGLKALAGLFFTLAASGSGAVALVSDDFGKAATGGVLVFGWAAVCAFAGAVGDAFSSETSSPARSAAPRTVIDSPPTRHSRYSRSRPPNDTGTKNLAREAHQAEEERREARRYNSPEAVRARRAQAEEEATARRRAGYPLSPRKRDEDGPSRTVL